MNLPPAIPQVEECLRDILSVVEETEREEIFIHGETIGPPTDETILISYLVRAKYRELGVARDCSDQEIFCEYCGDSDEHILQVRGGGGSWGASDEMCVTWQGGQNGGGPIETNFSCISCCNSSEDVELVLLGRQMKETCIGCGIHTSLKGDGGMSGLKSVSLCLQDSEPGIATDYYFCDYCRDDDLCELKQLVIERIKRLRKFYEYEGDGIQISEEFQHSSQMGLLFSESDEELELTSEEELQDTYYGEYENVEQPENNSAKSGEIKQVVRQIGEKIFDIQDQLKEGDYLEIMDLLQKVTNVVNSL